MHMSKSLVPLLNRRGGRHILGLVATYVARCWTGDDVEIFFQNGLWVRRVGQYYFPDGLRCKNSLSRALRWRGGAEWYLSNAEDYWFRHYRPKKGDVILDIGAGHGEDTFAFSQAVGGEGSVIAIEAHPLSFRILHELCRLNGFSNTILLQAAVMDKVGTVSIVEANAWNFHSIDQKTSTLHWQGHSSITMHGK